MTFEISTILIFIVILIVFFINKQNFILFTNSVLGKLSAIILVLLYANIHIGLGIFILMLIITYYKYYGNDNMLLNASDFLHGIDCIYWINLDRSIDRKQKMEKMFTDPIFSGKPIRRIDAVDGKTHDTNDMIKSKKRRNTNLEYACLLSHLKAIQTFSETEYDTALIFEDDVTLEFKQYWKKSLKKIIDNAPDDWEIIQLCYITSGKLNAEYTLNNYEKNYYGNIASMAAYVIKNKAAKKFMNESYDPETGQFILKNFHTHEADHYLYKCLRTYTYKYPYFIYPTDNDSTLHPEDLASHIRSKLQLEKMYSDMQ